MRKKSWRLRQTFEDDSLGLGHLPLGLSAGLKPRTFEEGGKLVDLEQEESFLGTRVLSES